MSKRHKKFKLDVGELNFDDDSFSPQYSDLLEAPRGKKPKGKLRRESHKRAYYDD